MIHLHVHTNFSLLQGTIRIEALIQTCVKQNIKSIALTDTNAMNGLVQFAKQASECKINPILGSCITDPEDEKGYIILLAKNNEGYSDLCKIITQRKLNDDFSILNILSQVWKNLFLITPFVDLLNQVNKKNIFYIYHFVTKKSRFVTFLWPAYAIIKS